MIGIALALCGTLALSGCSFAFVDGPPRNHQQMPMFDCTSSRVVPALDTVWTVLQSLNLAYAASSTDEEWEDSQPMSRSASIPLYIGLAALGAAGMYYGYTRTSRCRAAKNQLMLRLGTQGQGQGTWPPPAPTPAPAPAPTPAPDPDSAR